MPDINDSIFEEFAQAILRQHESGLVEANITSAIRDFLIATGLAKR